jgi:hypothetical protein
MYEEGGAGRRARGKGIEDIYAVQRCGNRSKTQADMGNSKKSDAANVREIVNRD